MAAAVALTIGLLGMGAIVTGHLPVAAADEENCVWPFIHPSCPWPFPDPVNYPFDDEAYGEGGGGGGGPKNSEEVKKVAEKVKKALADDACNAFVSGKQPKASDARTTFATNTIVEKPNRTAPNDPGAFASIGPKDLGRGSGGKITTWKPFHSDSILTENRDKSKAYRPLYNLIKDYDVRQLRALLLIHELGHIQGSVPADHRGSWGDNPHPEIAYIAKLASVCKPPK
jgi:hypothetical protein